MSNPPPRFMGSLTKWIIIALVAFAALLFTYNVFIVVFSVVVVYFLWEYHDRVRELEKRVEELSVGKPSDAPPPI